jgi:hypothetical protein
VVDGSLKGKFHGLVVSDAERRHVTGGLRGSEAPQMLRRLLALGDVNSPNIAYVKFLESGSCVGCLWRSPTSQTWYCCRMPFSIRTIEARYGDTRRESGLPYGFTPGILRVLDNEAAVA